MSYVSATLETYLATTPELLHTAGGKTIGTGAIAVQKRVNKGEKWVNEGPTEWINIKAWEDAGEALVRAGKGAKVRLSGRFDVESWTGRDGAERSKLVFVASKVDVVQASRPQAAAPAPRRAGPVNDVDDENIPF